MLDTKKPNMMTYINEEQSMAKEILSKYPDNISEFTNYISNETKEWLILATGSSINAAKSAKYYLQKILDIHIHIEEPFNYTHYERINKNIDMVIGISQSGQSTSTIEALDRIKKEANCPAISLTSDITSEISEVSDLTIDVGCGKERVGYVTKGFTATTLTFMLLGLYAAKSLGKISEEDEKRDLNIFRKLTENIHEVIMRTEDFFNEYKDELINAPRFTSVGYGPTNGTAKEMETKFCETIRVPSQGIDLEAFMHGPYLEVNPEHRIFFMETESSVKEKMERLRSYENKYTKYVYTVKFGDIKEERTISIPLVEGANEYHAPYIMIVPFQILSHHIAEAKGNNLGQRIYTDFGVSMKSKTKPGDYV